MWLDLQLAKYLGRYRCYTHTAGTLGILRIHPLVGYQVDFFQLLFLFCFLEHLYCIPLIKNFAKMCSDLKLSRYLTRYSCYSHTANTLSILRSHPLVGYQVDYFQMLLPNLLSSTLVLHSPCQDLSKDVLRSLIDNVLRKVQLLQPYSRHT